MRRSSLLAAAVGGLFSASAFAGFTYTYEVSALPVGTYSPTGGTAGPAGPANGSTTPLYSINIFAVNTGGDTGSGVLAYELKVGTLAQAGGFGLPTLFNTGVSGTPDVTYYDSGNGVRRGEDRSYVTLVDVPTSDSGAGTINETYGLIPSNARDPAGSFGTQTGSGPRTGGVSNFRLTGTGGATVADATLNGGKGLQIAHLIVAGTGSYTVSPAVAGSVGVKVVDVKTLQVGAPGTTTPGNLPPSVTVLPPAVILDVSPAGLEGFSAAVNAADTDGTIASITNSALDPKIADNIVIAGTGASRTITGSGFTYADLGTYTITFTATDNLGATSTGGVFTLSVVPEPASLSLVGLAGAALLRRRR